MTATAVRTLEIASAKFKDPAIEGAAAVYNTTADLWHTYVSRVIGAGRHLTAHDVLQLLGMLAMSRTLIGAHSPSPSDFVEQAMCIAGAAEAAGVSFPTLAKPPKGAVVGGVIDGSNVNDQLKSIIDSTPFGGSKQS